MHDTLRQTGRRISGNPWVVIRGSVIHGRGIFAQTSIPKGTRILEYVGDRISKSEGFRRSSRQIELNRRNGTHGAVYIFEVSPRIDIDGNVSWNPARLINHSCDPNCETVIERGRVWIESIRSIRPGEELAYDYGYDLDYWQDHPCRCGSTQCCGYIVRSNLRWRLKKKLQAIRLSSAVKPA
jgi:SET domain-containing protein